MSVPGVGVGRAPEHVTADATTADAMTALTDNETVVKTDEEPDDLENARISGVNDGNPYGMESNLESGGSFQTNACGHMNWPNTVDPPENGQRNSTPKRGSLVSRKGSVTTYNQGGFSRRQSTISQVSSEARAEATSWAQMTPLLAATFGPLAVLLGIPTLTQPWRGEVLDPPLNANGTANFIKLPDPTFNLVLAGISLFCEVMGNALLVLRFSNFHTKVTTWVSYAFWMAKIVIGTSNYIQFGITHPQGGNIIYLQGFWVIIFDQVF